MGVRGSHWLLASCTTFSKSFRMQECIAKCVLHLSHKNPDKSTSTCLTESSQSQQQTCFWQQTCHWVGACNGIELGQTDIHRINGKQGLKNDNSRFFYPCLDKAFPPFLFLSKYVYFTHLSQLLSHIIWLKCWMFFFFFFLKINIVATFHGQKKVHGQ